MPGQLGLGVALGRRDEEREVTANAAGKIVRDNPHNNHG
jgi:hypothetical protein